MARNGSGSYSLPSGNPVVAGTTIEADWANSTLADIATELGNSLDRSGRGGMLAAIKAIDGTISAPGITFSNETSSGISRAATNDLRLSIDGTVLATFTPGSMAVDGVTTYVTGSSDPGILTTQQDSVRIAHTSPLGGTLGDVRSPLVIDHKIPLGANTFDWSMIARNSNYDDGDGDKVAIYGQAYKYHTAGKSFGGVFETQDFSGNSGAGIVVGIEVDVFANGSAGAASRVGGAFVFGKGNPALTIPTIGAGLTFSPWGLALGNAKLGNGIRFDIDCTGAILKFTNNMSARYVVEMEDASTVDYFMRFKTAGMSMFQLESSGGAIGTYVGRLKVVIDTYVYWIPIYGNETTVIPM